MAQVTGFTVNSIKLRPKYRQGDHCPKCQGKRETAKVVKGEVMEQSSNLREKTRMRECILVNRFTQKNYIESFLDASESHKISANWSA